MPALPIDIDTIFKINTDEVFNEIALKIFYWQAENVPVYKEYLKSLGVKGYSVKNVSEIPFLPIQFFKSKKVIVKDTTAVTIFKSSGTTETGRSNHYVANPDLYEKSFTNGFKWAYKNVENTCIIALLPNYLEQGDSSLIYMVKSLISQSKHPKSGFYLNGNDDLLTVLDSLKQTDTKTILIGVTYALLDFLDKNTLHFHDLIVMETGGMKGRRKEIVREELHQILCKDFGVTQIHSEYGMTELLSQAYSKGNGVFSAPPWMKILTREINDPLSLNKTKKAGGINVIDFANIYSCSFIATQDLGRVLNGNKFEIIGRFDNSDTRGCNLMIV